MTILIMIGSLLDWQLYIASAQYVSVNQMRTGHFNHNYRSFHPEIHTEPSLFT